MSLSDCAKCWETPCVCGHDYQQWSASQLASQILMLTKRLDDKIHTWHPPEKKWRKPSFIVLRYSYNYLPDKLVYAAVRDRNNQYRSFWGTVPNFRGGSCDCGQCEWFERTMAYDNIEKWRFMTPEEETVFRCQLYSFDRK